MTNAVTAKATAEVTSLSLFGGEITAATVTVKVAARADGGNAKADYAGTRVVGLQVFGAPVAGEPGTEIPLADWGKLTVLTRRHSRARSEVRRGSASRCRRSEVELLADHGGLPAGSTITVGYANSAVQAATPVLQETTTSRPPVTTFVETRSRPRSRRSRNRSRSAARA